MNWLDRTGSSAWSTWLNRDEIEYSPLTTLHDSPAHKSSRQARNNRWRTYVSGALFVVCGLLVGLLVGYKSKRGASTGSVYDHFQNINTFPPAHPTRSINHYEKAVVTSLYNDIYTVAVSTLGHSLTEVNTSARKIAIYFPGRISAYSLCHVKAAGWELFPVEYIPPPHNGEGLYWRFADQYTKLRIWTLDQIGIKSAVYLDADTLVRNNFDELFESPFEFGAVPDVFTDQRGFALGINAGVLAFKPDTRVFEDMLLKLEDAKFNLLDAEQSYLNLYFAQQMIRLPHIYNGNLAIKAISPEYWDAMRKNLRVMHFTLVKPFNADLSCGERNCSTTEIFDVQMHRDYLRKAKTHQGGLFKEEVAWWGTVYEDMMRKVGAVCVSQISEPEYLLYP